MTAKITIVAASYIVLHLYNEAGTFNGQKVVDYKDVHVANPYVGQEFSVVIDKEGGFNFWLK